MTQAQFFLVTGIMLVYGVVIGFIAGLIWKENKPIGVKGDYIVAVVSCVVFGLGEWYLLPMLNFGKTIQLLGTFLEAPGIALAILWLIRFVKKK
jgi:uncharacterized membrane protein YeaQ/YmgE (transglycosylase-associated protein family)